MIYLNISIYQYLFNFERCDDLAAFCRFALTIWKPKGRKMSAILRMLLMELEWKALMTYGYFGYLLWMVQIVRLKVYFQGDDISICKLNCMPVSLVHLDCGGSVWSARFMYQSFCSNWWCGPCICIGSVRVCNSVIIDKNSKFYCIVYCC